MGWRQRYKRGEYPWYVGFGCIWNGRKQGRFWKRMLSKSRRRSWKQGRPERGEDLSYRGQRAYETECNYKSW
jgi:hypothetical protein